MASPPSLTSNLFVVFRGSLSPPLLPLARLTPSHTMPSINDPPRLNADLRGFFGYDEK